MILRSGWQMPRRQGVSMLRGISRSKTRFPLGEVSGWVGFQRRGNNLSRGRAFAVEGVSRKKGLQWRGESSKEKRTMSRKKKSGKKGIEAKINAVGEISAEGRAFLLTKPQENRGIHAVAEISGGNGLCFWRNPEPHGAVGEGENSQAKTERRNLTLAPGVFPGRQKSERSSIFFAFCSRAQRF